MVNLFFVLFSVLILLAIAIPKSRAVSILLLLYMWVIYGCNTYSGDFIAYQNVYENIEQLKFHYEPAFSLMMLICHRCGLSFYGFRMIIAIIFLSLLIFTVAKNTQYTALTLAVFCLCPFFFFVSVLRAGLAGLIIVNACTCLGEMKKGYLVRFILLIGLATAFHYTSVVFLILIFDEFFSKRMVFILLIISSIVIYVLLKHGDYIAILVARFTDREKTLEWFSLITNTSNLNIIGKITGVAVVFGNAVAANQLKNQYIHEHYYEGTDNQLCNTIIIAERVTYILIILAPFMIVSDVLLRFVWEIQLLVIIGCINAIEPPDYNDIFKKRITFPEILFIFCILFAFYKIGSFGTVISLMNDNFLLAGH